MTDERSPEQLTRSQLQELTPAERLAAFDSGACDALTGRVTAAEGDGEQPARRFKGSGDGGARQDRSAPGGISREDLACMTPAQRIEAFHKGRLRHLL